MTVDLLSVRLKEAKKELTALKTAHMRGLGLLRIYKNDYLLADYNIEDDTINYVTMTINFDTNFPPYPICELIGQVKGIATTMMTVNIDSITYTNSGYTMVCDCVLIRWDAKGMTEFFIVSTTPISNIIIEET